MHVCDEVFLCVKKFCEMSFLVLFSSFKTDLYSQMLTAKDYIFSTLNVNSLWWICVWSREHLTDHNNDLTNWQNELRFFFFFLIGAILYFFFCGKSQLAVLMHSWWLMTGVLSDHGILMATYPWLSKAVYRKLLGAATAAVCLPNGQLSAHILSVSPKFLFDFVLFI